MASTRGIQDTSRQGRFHNAWFRALAKELGLDVAKVARTSEICVGQDGAVEFRVIELCAAELRADEARFGEVDAVEPRVHQFRAAEECVGKVRPEEMSLGEVGAG